MASVPPTPALSKLPDAIDRALQPVEIAPIPPEGTTIEPIDPSDVHPIPAPDPDLPAPPDDAPTEQDLQELRDKQGTPVRDEPIEIAAGPQAVEPEAAPERAGQDIAAGGDSRDGVESDGDEHDADHSNDDHDGGSEI